MKPTERDRATAREVATDISVIVSTVTGGARFERVADRIAAAIAAEREANVNAVCQHCREGRPLYHGDHVLEEVQGHVAHSVRCPATLIRARGDA